MKEYRIIIGIGEDRHGRPIGQTERDQALDIARQYLTDRWGGYTAYAHQGGWRNDQGKLVTERGVTYAIVTSEDSDIVRLSAYSLARIFDQQSVVFIYPDGTSDFIEPDYVDKAEDTPLEDILNQPYADGRDTFHGH